MPTLSVPEEHQSGLARIARLSNEEAESISVALTEAKTTKTRELTGLTIGAVPSLTVKEAREIVETLRSLYGVRSSLDIPIENFIEDVLRAAKRNTDTSAQDHGVSAESLRKLLNVHPLSMIAKARDLHIDHANVFCSARVMTDLRPVFDVDVSEEPAGFVLAHTLKLGFHRRKKHEEIYVAMDKQDMQSLIDVLQRAQLKATSISAMAQKKKFSILAD